jgi:SARP family transcriptional regulator, regulator of embCAB operon
MNRFHVSTNGAGAPTTVQMFGPIGVRTDGRVLGPRDFASRKPKQVLEILLAARGHLLPKDRLGDLLWGDKPPENVHAGLETYVSLLRRALGTEKCGERALIVTEPHSYRFAAERADIDVDRFDTLRAQAARKTRAGARACLESALALATGELFEDEPYARWAEELRETYREKVQQLRLDAAKLAVADRDFSTALAYAEAAIERDHFDERGYRIAMVALYAQGRQHHALEMFRRCRVALNEELGIEPLHETKALQVAILQQVGRDVAAAGIEPRDELGLLEPRRAVS